MVKTHSEAVLHTTKNFPTMSKGVQYRYVGTVGGLLIYYFITLPSLSYKPAYYYAV
jgi:hypothetical protein